MTATAPVGSAVRGTMARSSHFAGSDQASERRRLHEGQCRRAVEVADQHPQPLDWKRTGRRCHLIPSCRVSGRDSRLPRSKHLVAQFQDPDDQLESVGSTPPAPTNPAVGSAPSDLASDHPDHMAPRVAVPALRDWFSLGSTVDPIAIDPRDAPRKVVGRDQPPHQPAGAAEWTRLRRVRGDGRLVVPSASLRGVRTRGLLRFIAVAAR